VHDMLSSLTGINLLARTSEGRYRLGWRVASLAVCLYRGTPLGRQAAPILRHLAEESCGEARPVVRDRDRAVVLDRVAHPTAARRPVEQVSPVQESAAGKVILADLTWDTALGDLSPSSIAVAMDVASLREELQLTRRRG